ncbi:MAG TPA: hypothetical protein PK566_03370 [Pseudobacteroides sp.]|nr:hypothetical protein [Pseudobacteroides sp.]
MPDTHKSRKYSARREINTAIDYLWENTNMEEVYINATPEYGGATIVGEPKLIK